MTAYKLAGFVENKSGARAVDLKPEVMTRVSELIDQRYRIDKESTVQALERACVTKYDIVMELKAIGFARMNHFTSLDGSGEPFLDLTKLEENPEYWAAVKEVVVEEYVEGKGDDARDVKRTRISLHDKQTSLKTLGSMHGMIETGSKVQVGVGVTIVMTEDELNG